VGAKWEEKKREIGGSVFIDAKSERKRGPTGPEKRVLLRKEKTTLGGDWGFFHD